jgi:hypothetical protein
MIYQTVTEYIFIKAFQDLRPNNFTYEGLQALYVYLEELSNDTGNFELDVIAICCEFTEMDIEELVEAYEGQYDDCVVEWLRDQTTVISVGEDRYIVQEF